MEFTLKRISPGCSENDSFSPEHKRFTSIRSDFPDNFLSVSDKGTNINQHLLNDSFEFDNFDVFESCSSGKDKETKKHARQDFETTKPFLKSLISFDLVVENIFKRLTEIVVVAKDANCSTFRLILRGFWTNASLKEKEKCRIFVVPVEKCISESNDCFKQFVFDSEGDNFLLIKPDLLLSSTTITSAVFCRRKTVLGEKILSVEDSNKAMLVGSIVHEIFQIAFLRNVNQVEELKLIRDEIVSRFRTLDAMYFSSVSEQSLFEEISPYFPQISHLLKLKFQKNCSLFGDPSSETATEIRFECLRDVEENIWSSRYGIRGKIDLTVEASLPYSNSRCILPVELKTGKLVSSAEHKGQVLLYNAMSFDLLPEKSSKFGALVYLKESKIQRLELKSKEFHGLIQLRNDLARYFDDFSRDGSRFLLPDPIENERFCHKCPQLLNCCLFEKLCIDNTDINDKENNFRSNLISSVLDHLSEKDYDYLKKWLKWICLENNELCKRKRLSDIWNLTANERELRGEAISDLKVSDQVTMETDSYEVVLLRNNNGKSWTAGIFESGDFAVLSNETVHHLAVAMGTVTFVDEKMIKLVTNKKLIFSPSDTFRLDQYFNESTSLKFNLSNLLRLFEKSKLWLRELLISGRQPLFERKITQSEITAAQPYFKFLNKEQSLAVLKVLRADKYVLIKGLPGSGKTSTICALINILVSLKKSVLVTSYTHSAVDNVLRKLQQQFFNILRLGSKFQVHSECRKFLLENRLLDSGRLCVDNVKLLYETTPVVAATCSTVTNHPLFSRRKFDVVIVDEATLLHEVSCLAPLFAAEKFVLVGDSQQLQPLVVSKICKEEGMACSLFDRLEREHPNSLVTLNKQYRMNEEISKMSGTLFYDGKLTCANDTVSKNFLPEILFAEDISPWLRLCLSGDSLFSVLFLDTSDAKEYFSTRDGPGRLKNNKEAEIIFTIVQTLRKNRFDMGKVGVICPYRHQCKVISDLLAENDVEVNTVDKYQGRDKDIILVSMVWTRSNQLNEQENPSDLLLDPRRVNVLLTRSKQKLILIGCRRDLCQTYEWICKLCNILSDDQIVIL